MRKPSCTFRMVSFSKINSQLTGEGNLPRKDRTVNAKRRAAIALRIGQVEDAAGTLEDILSHVTDLQGEEQEAFDNMSENLQQGEKGQLIEANATALQQAMDHLQTAIDGAADAVTELQEAAGE